MSPCLPQSKFYLKIINILYILENTDMLINSSIVESIIKSTHIFNDVLLAFKPQVIKESLKSDMAIMLGMVHTRDESLQYRPRDV